MAQRGRAEFEDYDGFVEKFVPKKTADDCYTPPEVYEAVLGYAKYGVDFKVRRGEAVKVAKLDAQGKGGIYGGGFLMGDALAAERAAAERAAARTWRLSPRERALVEQLKPLGE